MTKKKITLDPNQVVVDWDFNTGDLVLQIQTGHYNLRDADKPDFNTISMKEKKWRAEYEEIRKAILEAFK